MNINAGGNNLGSTGPEHRHGVRYGNANVQDEGSATTTSAAVSNQRMDFRGRGGNQVLRPEVAGAAVTAWPRATGDRAGPAATGCRTPRCGTTGAGNRRRDRRCGKPASQRP